jgi:hypothetical protein
VYPDPKIKNIKSLNFIVLAIQFKNYFALEKNIKNQIRGINIKLNSH